MPLTRGWGPKACRFTAPPAPLVPQQLQHALVTRDIPGPGGRGAFHPRCKDPAGLTGPGRGIRRGQTASAPVPKTASAPPGPPACGISPCTARPRTGSGWRSCRSRWTHAAWMPMLALTSKTRLAPPPAAPPVHHGRATRDHRPSAYPPPGPAPALEQPHHRRPRPAQPTPRTQSDQWMPRPFDSTSTPKAVESGAIPRRHSGLQPAQPQPMARKRSTDSSADRHEISRLTELASRTAWPAECWG